MTRDGGRGLVEETVLGERGGGKRVMFRVHQVVGRRAREDVLEKGE